MTRGPTYDAFSPLLEPCIMSLLPPRPVASPATKKRPSGLLSGGHLVTVNSNQERQGANDGARDSVKIGQSPILPDMHDAAPEGIREPSGTVQLRQTKKRKLESLVAKMKTEACNRVMEQSLRDMAELTQPTTVSDKNPVSAAANCDTPLCKVPRKLTSADARAVSIDLPDGKCKVWLEGISEQQKTCDTPQEIARQPTSKNNKILHSLLTNTAKLNESRNNTRDCNTNANSYVSILRRKSSDVVSTVPKCVAPSLKPHQKRLRKLYTESLLKPLRHRSASSDNGASLPLPVPDILLHASTFSIPSIDCRTTSYVAPQPPQHIAGEVQTVSSKIDMKKHSLNSGSRPVDPVMCNASDKPGEMTSRSTAMPCGAPASPDVSSSPQGPMRSLTEQHSILDLSRRRSSAEHTQCESDGPIDLTCKNSMRPAGMAAQHRPVRDSSSEAPSRTNNAWLRQAISNGEFCGVKSQKSAGLSSAASLSAVIDLSRTLESKMSHDDIVLKSEKPWCVSSTPGIPCSRSSLLSSGGSMIMAEGVSKTMSVLNSSAVLMQSLVTGHVYSDTSWKYHPQGVASKSFGNSDKGGPSGTGNGITLPSSKTVAEKHPSRDENKSSGIHSGLLSGEILKRLVQTDPSSQEQSTTKSVHLSDVLHDSATAKTIVPFSIEPVLAVAGENVTMMPSPNEMRSLAGCGGNPSPSQTVTHSRGNVSALSQKRSMMDKLLRKSSDSSCDSDVEITGSKKRTRHVVTHDIALGECSKPAPWSRIKVNLDDYKHDIIILGSDIDNGKIVKIEKLSQGPGDSPDDTFQSDSIIDVNAVKSEGRIPESTCPMIESPGSPGRPVKQEVVNDSPVPSFPVIGSIQLLGDICVSKVSDGTTETKEDTKDGCDQSSVPCVAEKLDVGPRGDNNCDDDKVHSKREVGSVIHCTKRKDVLNVITISGNSSCSSPKDSLPKPDPVGTSDQRKPPFEKNVSERGNQPGGLERNEQKCRLVATEMKGPGVVVSSAHCSDMSKNERRKSRESKDSDKDETRTTCDTNKKSSVPPVLSQDGVSSRAPKKDPSDPNPNYVIEITPQPMWGDRAAISKDQVYRSLLTGKIVKPSLGTRAGGGDEPTISCRPNSTAHPTKTLMIIQQVPGATTKDKEKIQEECEQANGKRATQLESVAEASGMNNEEGTIKEKEEQKAAIAPLPEAETLAGVLWRELVGPAPEADELSLEGMTPGSLLSWPDYDLDLNQPTQFVDWNNDIIDLDFYDPLNIQSDWKLETVDATYGGSNETVLNLKSDMTLGTVTIRSSPYRSAPCDKPDSVPSTSASSSYVPPSSCKVEIVDSETLKGAGAVKKSSKTTSHSKTNPKAPATETSKDVMVVHQPEFIDLSELKGIKKLSKR